MNQECFARRSEVALPLGYPLDELLIMHRLTQEKAIELHGLGIVGPNGASNLFIGHSGAGKSTTARLWTSLHEVEILSDDRIIVREHDEEIFMYGTPWHGEAHFALPKRAPLQRIFVLEHGRGNVITRLTRSQMVAELFARSFVPFHRHEYVDHALSFLERIADTVPCYRYSFEPDERAVDKILHFHD
jgi:energy-coupling factor transporter ATP-binding protein EcfA2